eukprot:5104020-Pleurochrysis_carterae.AAC.1
MSLLPRASSLGAGIYTTSVLPRAIQPGANKRSCRDMMIYPIRRGMDSSGCVHTSGQCVKKVPCKELCFGRKRGVCRAFLGKYLGYFCRAAALLASDHFPALYCGVHIHLAIVVRRCRRSFRGS